MPEELRSDVRFLSTLLGRVLVEAVGDDLLDDVETLRTLAIEARSVERESGEIGSAGESRAITRAEEFVASLSAERAEQVARAFTVYFHLANLAEEYQRTRALARRDTEEANEHPGLDSYAGAYARLVDEVGEKEATERVKRLEFRPVFTAHPTEARRRAVSSGIRRIHDLLVERDDPRLGFRARDENERALLAQIDVLWRTAPLRAEKPSPVDEVRTAMAVFDEVLFEILPFVYRRLDAAVHEPDARTAPVARPFVRIGSWIGGDRDGNPNVTPKMTRTAAAIANEHVLLGLEKASLRIGRMLTLDAGETPPSQELLALRDAQRQLDEELYAAIAKRSPREPHRQVLLFAAKRVEATRLRNADLAYRDAGEFLRDLETIRASLLAAGDERTAYSEVQNLIWQVETFGFHLTELEVRQHSKVHRTALEKLEAGEEPDEATTEALDLFRTIALIQQRYGALAARRYIISFTQSADDIRNVYRLAEFAAPDAAKRPVLDVIPLFETFDDLRAAPGILEEMIQLPEVQKRLAETDRRLEAMLGYSDSSKDVGPVSATLALYRAQAEIAEWAARHDISLTLFHGRGGALGRGGGPANQAVLSQPPGSVDCRFKLTEQGEVIFARYGDREIAKRHIEQVASATLLQSAPSIEKRNAEAAERFAGLAEKLDDASRKRFFELVKAEGFAPWFATVTPQEEVGWLAIGSRPARRGLSVESLEDLRAIPWVFAWTQARINLTGWFGLGSALKTVGDVDLLRSAYEEWPLFRAMIENVEMSLAKTDDRIAKRYLALGDRDDLAQLVTDEMALTREWVLKTTGAEGLLHGRRVLRRAVELRSPYVDALSLLQLRALRAIRDEEKHEGEAYEAARRLLLLSVSGVAAGLQNTG